MVLKPGSSLLHLHLFLRIIVIYLSEPVKVTFHIISEHSEPVKVTLHIISEHSEPVKVAFHIISEHNISSSTYALFVICNIANILTSIL